MVWKNNIFIFGGFIGNPHPHYSNTLYKFDLTNSLYKEKKTTGSLPPPRSDHTAIVFNDTMVVFGGITQGNHYLNDVFCLNLLNMEWACLTTQGENPSERIGHAAVGYDGNLIIFGGYEEASKEETKIYSLNLENWSWRKFGDAVIEEEYLADLTGPGSPTKKTLTDSKISGSRSPTRFEKTKSQYQFSSPLRTKTLQSIEGDEKEKSKSPLATSTLRTSKYEQGPDTPSKKITVESLKQERLKKKKEQEKKRLLGEFEHTKIDERDIMDKEILKMQTVLSSITSEKAAKSIFTSSMQKQKMKVMRPGVSLFAEKIRSKLDPVRLPHLDGISMVSDGSKVYVFGGDRCGLCSNDLYMFDSLELLQNTQTTQLVLMTDDDIRK